jgi:hypothetical protein
MPAPLKNPRRMLYVEDNRGDFVLVRELLREGFGGDFTREWAARTEEVIAGIQRAKCLDDLRSRGRSG